VTLRTKDKFAKSPDEVLNWIKDLNPGLHTEHWGISDKQPEPKGQRLIPLTDGDSQIAINVTGYRIFSGLPQSRSPRGKGWVCPPPPKQKLLNEGGQWRPSHHLL
jgi:hypothetical protein